VLNTGDWLSPPFSREVRRRHHSVIDWTLWSKTGQWRIQKNFWGEVGEGLPVWINSTHRGSALDKMHKASKRWDDHALGRA